MSAMTAVFTPSAGACLSGAWVALAYADAAAASQAAATVLSVPAPGARI